jgi:folate-binding protein YgfZ
MNPSWKDFLVANGANAGEVAPDGFAVSDFGNPRAELQAARDASVVAPIAGLSMLEIAGADAGDFLHNQFSSDVEGLASWQAQTSAYCSPKGRVLANFFLWREPERFCALLSADLTASIRKRLSMFVLRSKVALSDAFGDLVLLGVSGPAAAPALTAVLGAAPDASMTAVKTQSATILHLGFERFLLVLPAHSAQTLWTALAAQLTPVGAPAWRWLDIRSGIPWITAATQDQFVPQMANLELTGAVNFQKGCYPGQEIVARTQYLGKLKRRMFRCHADNDSPPAAGTALYSVALGEQACGMVVNASVAPGGGCDMLAVMQIEAAESANLSPPRVGAIDGPALSILELPYHFPQAA